MLGLRLLALLTPEVSELFKASRGRGPNPGGAVRRSGVKMGSWRRAAMAAAISLVVADVVGVDGADDGVIGTGEFLDVVVVAISSRL